MQNIGFAVLGAELFARLAVIPYIMMSGGVVIANQLGYSTSQNFPLFMAVASLTAFPWLVKAIIDLIVQSILTSFRRTEMDRMMNEFNSLNPSNPQNVETPKDSGQL